MSDLGETGSIVDLGTPVPGGAFDAHHPPDAALIPRATGPLFDSLSSALM